MANTEQVNDTNDTKEPVMNYQAHAYESQTSMQAMEPHELSPFSVIAHFNTSEKEGLNKAQVQKLHESGNYNVLCTQNSICPCSASKGAGLLPKDVKVMRDGKIIMVETKDLVVGDLVHIKKGNIIAADIRLIEAIDLTVNNEVLGGSAIAVTRTADADMKNTEFLDYTNMVYAGVMCVEGKGRGVVVNIGLLTRLGQQLLQDPQESSCVLS